MSKPRVIIADPDINYVVALQSRFIDDYADSIDLEVITDSDYLDELFMSPQRALLLIITENLYNDSFTKHGIDHIFVLTENAVKEDFGDKFVEGVFKYTSVSEIFARIESTCFRDIRENTVDSKYTDVIAVCSGKGGVGKTTISLGLAGYLSQNYKRVLYINVAELQNFHAYIDNVSTISDPEIYKAIRIENTSIFKELKASIRKGSFYYLPPFKAPLFSLGISKKIFSSLIEEAKQSFEYDYIVVDIDSEFSEEVLNLIDISNHVIFVTEQDYASALATNRMAESISGVSNEKFVFVCNKYDGNKPNEIVEQAKKLKFTISNYIGVSQSALKTADEFAYVRGIEKLAYHII